MRHTRKTTRVKGVQDVPPRLGGTVQGHGDLRGFPALRTGSHDLAAAHSEGIMTAQPGLKRGPLFVCDVSNRPWWLHRAEPIIVSLLAQILC
jgi:hypothetical protein